MPKRHELDGKGRVVHTVSFFFAKFTCGFMRKELTYMKNCLEEYLTDHCAKCSDWRDGSDGTFGCAIHGPIMWCPHFAKMVEECEAKRKEDQPIRVED